MNSRGKESFHKVKKGVVKRSQRRVIGVFIDGVGLDRATKRLNKRVDFASLIRGISGGLEPTVCRYYTIIPYEDDSRQNGFLDAIYKVGLDVVLKRLPPKGVDRQATIDIELAADIIAFTRGHNRFSAESIYLPEEHKDILAKFEPQKPSAEETPSGSEDIQRVVITVCPSRDLAYAIQLANELGADTVTADFATHHGGNVLKSASKFIDLSDSNTIWKE